MFKNNFITYTKVGLNEATCHTSLFCASLPNFKCDNKNYESGNCRCLEPYMWDPEPQACDKCIEGFFKSGSTCR